jgi:hypothetical protein
MVQTSNSYTARYLKPLFEKKWDCERRKR